MPQRRSYRQTLLAEEYNISTENAHNAVADVAVLEALVDTIGVTRLDLVRHLKNIPCVIQQEDRLASKKINAQSLKTLQPKVTACMVGKIAAAGISLENLKAAVVSGGLETLKFLLAQDVNGKPRVTKMKKKIEEILEAVEALLEDDNDDNNNDA